VQPQKLASRANEKTSSKIIVSKLNIDNNKVAEQFATGQSNLNQMSTDLAKNRLIQEPTRNASLTPVLKQLQFSSGSAGKDRASLLSRVEIAHNHHSVVSPSTNAINAITNDLLFNK
jgi:hypothetical protein